MNLDMNSVLLITNQCYMSLCEWILNVFCGVVQAMMSINGYDIPLGRTTKDNTLRQEVFDLIAPYVL
jgi:hypothetical protein